MTKSNIHITPQKRILLKSFIEFKGVQKVLQILQTLNKNTLQISIIGKHAQKTINSERSLILEEDELISQCGEILKSPIDFGIIPNPEIGTIFIIGSFAPMFLQEVNGKKLGSMPMGPYSILRGLGIDEESVTANLKALVNGSYLIILRGHYDELNLLKGKLSDVWIL